MVTRKAGDSLLKAAYQDALLRREPLLYSDGSTGGAVDYAVLERMLHEGGAAPLSANDLRALMNDAESPRRTRDMTAPERLDLIERYLQNSYGDIAPVLFPVRDAKGVYGASVVDADRLIAHELAGVDEPGNVSSDFAFVPSAASAELVHVLENQLVDEGIGSTIEKSFDSVLSRPTARAVYEAARNSGWSPLNSSQERVIEEFLESRSHGRPDEVGLVGPGLARLLQVVRQGRA
jgi:hypothetical protein